MESLPSIVSEPKRYDYQSLFQGKTLIEIEFNGRLYNMRITKSGGLILNKTTA